MDDPRPLGKSWQTNRCSDHTTGFALAELLVVLAILGLLLALFMPAVQAARESSRRMTCAHHLRQLVLAAAEYESTHLLWPPSAVPHDLPNLHSLGNQALSFHVRLLPYLDQEPIHQQIDPREAGIGGLQEPISSLHNGRWLTERIPVFECPSDTVPPGSVSYRLSMGSAPGWPNRTIARWLQGFRGEYVTDGTSQTIILSERLVGDGEAGQYTPWRDTAGVIGPDLRDPDEVAELCRVMVTPASPHWSSGGGSWLFSGFGHTWYNHVHAPNSALPDCKGSASPTDSFGFGMMGAHTARSFHPGGVHVACFDGSTRLVNSRIDLRLWRALGTESGGEPASWE